jgi:hypothetical protein
MTQGKRKGDKVMLCAPCELALRTLREPAISHPHRFFRKRIIKPDHAKKLFQNSHP